jgi:ankyrin repeat protein
LKRAENIDRHRTPLHDACASSHYLKGAIVKLLLDRGADVKRPFFSPYDPYWVYKSPVDLCLESLAVSEAQLVNLDFSDGTRIAKLYRACRQLRAEVVALTEVMEDVPRNELFIHADAKRCLSTSVVLKDLRDMQEIGVVRARQSLRSLIAKMALATDEELYQCWP